MTTGDAPPKPDRSLPLDIAGRLNSPDLGGMTGVTLMNVPPGAVLSAGVENGDGRWSLTPGELQGLTISPPAGWGGDIVLTASVTVQPGDGETAPTTVAFGITIPFTASDPETPEPEPASEATGPVAPETGEGIALVIDLGAADAATPETLVVTISTVPEGARLSAGTDTGNGIWTLKESDLEGLVIYPLKQQRDDFFLGLAISSEGEVIATGSLAVSMDEDAPLPFEPAPEPEPELTPEPEPEPVVQSPGPAPVAYWKLGEAASGTAKDEMGGHDGRVFGAAGADDALAAFDGLDDTIEVPHSDDMLIASGTLTAWVYTFATDGGVIAAKGNDFLLRVRGGRLEFQMGEGLTVDGGVFGGNEWIQVTVTWGSGGMKTFLNGQMTGAGEETGSLLANTSPWTFGGFAGDFLHGELNELAVYAAALDASGVDGLNSFGVEGLMTGDIPPETEDAADAGDGDIDSPLNFDAIQAEADGPDSLATIDTLALLSGDMENDDPEQPEAAPEPELEPVPEPEPEPEPDLDEVPEDGAITIGDGGELIVKNVEKLEW